MVVTRQIIEAVVLCIEKVVHEQMYADKAIERTLSDLSFINNEHRAYIASTVYAVLRYLRKLSVALGHEQFSSTISGWELWGAYRLLEQDSVIDFPECAHLHVNELKYRLEDASEAIINSYPDWLWQKGTQELGTDWLKVATALNVPATPYLRVNTLKTSKENLSKELDLASTHIKNIGNKEAVEVTQYGNLFKSNAFKQGLFEMQDAGSQQIAPLLDLEPGMRVVDACAGAGGKSLHIASLMENKGYLLSMDIHQHKLDTLKKRAKRAGVHIVETRLIKNSKTIKRLKEKFHRVLLDVPCSGSGIFRRNPDAKWHLDKADIESLVELQSDILQRYSQMCKVGGKLVYATCSVFPSENALQVASFLDLNSHFELESELNLLPGKNTDYDGFYAAVLKRVR